MEAHKQYKLINEKKWTQLLRSLDASADGEEYKFSLQSIKDICSFKAIAYALNSYRLGRKYSVIADKKEFIVKVIVKSI